MLGPDLTNSLIGVLLRLRLEPYPFTSDIASMFYQGFVPEEQQCFLRFFWWPNGNLKQEPRKFQMCLHVFSMLFKLRAEKNRDGLLKSSVNKGDVSRLALGVEKLCKEGAFDLTKFISTDSEILKLIPVEKGQQLP